MTEPPLPACDLVMKGGITSGIVYPPTVLELKKAYTFRSIGGTSAGALAAAGTAAAEYNRKGGGFEQLETVSKWLAQDGHLRDLFQAEPEMQPLLDMLDAALNAHREYAGSGAKDVRGTEELERSAQLPLFLDIVHALLPSVPLFTLVAAGRLSRQWATTYKPFQRGGRTGRNWGIALSFALANAISFMLIGIAPLFAPAGSPWRIWLFLGAFLASFAAFGLLLGWLGLWFGRIAGIAGDFLDIFSKRLPANGYGVCSGHTPVSDADNKNTNLTDWLSSIVDVLAGLPPMTSTPLTCGHLREKDIDLKMVTSNLSHGQPYVLPDDLQNFLFKESELRRLFPDYVVQHLITNAPEQPLLPPTMLPDDYHFLPDAANLPVVFCARLSLSYPLLLSAVPLYTVSASAYEDYLQHKISGKLDDARHLQRNWLSDGGICSNFPLQFFDAWLPERPTFGINLTSLFTESSALVPWPRAARSAVMAARNAGEAVYLPGAEDRPEPEWQPIEQITTFLGALFATAQNYRDTMQTQLPSYRERVIQIRLDAQEGGLNLTMPQQIIEHVAAKGTQAGQMLRDPQTFSFKHHWWVRFLVLMACLEENIETLQDFFEPGHEPGFAECLEQEWRSGLDGNSSYPYYRDQNWCIEACRRIRALQMLITCWQQADQHWGSTRFFRENSPLPGPVLRATPEI